MGARGLALRLRHASASLPRPDSSGPALFSCIRRGGAGLLQLKSSLPNNPRSEVQLPTHLFKETSTHLKLFQTPSSDSMSCRRRPKVASVTWDVNKWQVKPVLDA
ncbi:unnamed protein product [Pleuronectes platessa]|uniref:Uncharacterized protein n=1 Tax=Pleuronectes platessa TaxID=8262 RepID=A0A9N7Z0P4_PLEPL|nr:unnamed protein product [Pleuronectes platessa]